jgi:pimeloyl-ACP methyl ester carboxylesterase
VPSRPTELKVLWRDPVQPKPAEGGPVGGGPVEGGPVEPGAGRLAVLVHGAMDRATSFTRLMAKLPEWAILAYDRRGYAGSSRAGPPISFDQQVDDLASVLEQRAGDRPTVAFGHSFGGDVVLAALAAAGSQPGGPFARIGAAVVWEPPQPWQPWWPEGGASRGGGSELGPEDRAEWFMRRMVGDHIWERLPSSTRAQRRTEGPTLNAEMRSLAGIVAFDPACIRVPVIVGRGGRSRAHQRRGVEELVPALPTGELAEITDAGHGAHLSHPAEVAELIRRAAELAARPG